MLIAIHGILLLILKLKLGSSLYIQIINSDNLLSLISTIINIYLKTSL